MQFLKELRHIQQRLFKGGFEDVAKFRREVRMYNELCKREGDSRFVIDKKYLLPRYTSYRASSGKTNRYIFYMDLIAAKKIYELGVYCY